MAKDVLQGRSIVRKNIFDKAFGTIEQVKKENSLVGYFRSKGVQLEKSGTAGEYTGLCPFHDDKSPSLSVNETKGVFNCFGCGKSGSIIDAVSLYENTGTGEALKLLQSQGKPDSLKLTLPEEDKTTADIGSVPDLEAKQETPVTLPDVVKNHWHPKLFENKKALAYLKSRGLTDQGLYARFALGFSDGSLPKKLGQSQKEALQKAGILNEKGNEKFYNCLLFPILDEAGHAVSLYGRNIKDDAPVKHLYLAGGHKGIFNRKASKVYPERVILTECIIDALSLIQLGFNNVQALYGVNGFTDEHLLTLKEDRVKEIVIALDNDKAGREGAEKLKDRLTGEGFTVRVIFPPLPVSANHDQISEHQCYDWNGFILEGKTKDDLQALIDQAQPVAPKEKDSFTAEETKGKYTFTINKMIYILTGVKDAFVSSLKVNIKAGHDGDFHYDTLNLYSARSRTLYSAHLAGIFSVEPRRIEKDLILILEYLETERDRKLNGETEEAAELTEEEKELGLSFLTSPGLFDQIEDDLTTLGYMGERLNKLLLYLCATSRKMDDPISVLLVSQSASGKSYLVDTIRRFIPPDEVESITTLSDQALNYLDNLVHKFVVFGEAIHSETIEHQLREMLSSKELSRYVVQKDQKTGELATRKISKPVVVASVMSTTNHNINPENASRYFIINTDESREQTQRIYKAHRSKYSRERAQKKQDIIPEVIKKHHCAQRLLEKKMIVIPETMREAIDFPDTLMRLRRDHERFIDLIATVCFLRQYQKEIKKDGQFEYIECDPDDYTTAYHIMINGVLSSTLSEIPQQAVTLYDQLREMVREDARVQDLSPEEISFTQRQAREYTGFNQMYIKRYIKILTDYEYLNAKGAGARGSRKTYSLIADQSLNRINVDMIPTPEKMRELIHHKVGQPGQVVQTGSRPTLKSKK